MPKFAVSLKVEYHDTVWVEADSADHARQICNDPNFAYDEMSADHGEPEITVLSVEEDGSAD